MSGGLHAVLRVQRPGGFALDVELTVPPGRTVALLGPNGAGKSTVVSALAGLEPLDGGRVTLSERVLDDPEAGIRVAPSARGIGVVFQDLFLFPHMSVADNVAFGLREQGHPRPETRRLAAEWIQRIGLEGMESRRPPELSGGQAQRVALARALAPGPALLLLDEPLSALDVASRARIRRVLATHLSEFAGPRILITHDPAEAFQLADRIHVLEGGRVTQVGTPEEIRLRPKTPYAADLGGTNLFLGTASGGTVTIEGGAALTIADPEVQGPVRAAIPARAVAVHRAPPEGSARNRWKTVLEQVEDDGVRVRLLTGPPVPLTIQVTHDAARELDLTRGTEVWVSMKASEIRVEPG